LTDETETLEGSPSPPATRPDGQSPAGPDAIAAPARRRRVPSWLWGAAGAAVVLVYGLVVERMRFGPPLVVLALGGMTLALTAGAVWRMIDPLARKESPDGAAGVRGSRFVRELEREKQLVLKAIKEIEFDYQMRKIAERDYRKMVERYRQRAMRLISELDAGDDYRGLIEKELKLRLELPAPDASPPATTASSSSTGARPACPTCQTVNDPDAKFCKSCGGKL
jgi:hypothetical protein